ncbi:putative immunoglobulin-blocking virulence protein [Mycoplasma sp. 480]|uniref:putative immunoglobulin-blocking virulence protein n=1 Tax=Mycoplasma sp. 480 TaxID=3440155 RepID=UPI003F516FC6
MGTNFFKSTKNKKIIAISSVSIVTPITVGALFYVSTTDKANSADRSKLLNDNVTSINTGNNLNFKNGFNSHRDNNQEPKKVQPKKEEPVPEEPKKEEPLNKPISETPPPPANPPEPDPEPVEPDKPKDPEKPLIIDQPKEPEPQPEQPAPKEKPVIIDIIKPEPAPESKVPDPVITQPVENPKPLPTPTVKTPPSPDPVRDKNTEITVDFYGEKIRVNIEKPQARKIDQRDIAAGNANRVEYINQITPKLLGIKVTDKIIEANKRSSLRALAKDVPLNQADFPEIRSGQLTNDQIKEALDTDYRSTGYYRKIIDKFWKLIANGDKVVNFLTEEGKKAYYKELKAHKNEDWAKLKIISFLDMTKFTKLSSNAIKNLGEGMVIYDDNSNVYINDDGEIDSYAVSPLINSVTARITRDNSKKRVFGYNDWRARYPDEIRNGTYPGWTKSDVTNTYSSKYNFTPGQGIKFEKLTRDEPEADARNEGIVVTIDVANPNALEKTKKLIEDLTKANEQITSYRIINIGKKGSSNYDFFSIFQALPNKLPQLELFFENYNTSALLAIKDKEIDELSLLTTGNSLAEGWAINPIALKKVAWINTVDYNVSFNYSSRQTIATRITFDTIAFNDVNIGPNKDLTEINNALRMVYYVRNNEPFFQGSFGPGKDPDHNEGENSYPTGLDLSGAKQLKSLKGLIFSDTIKPSNKPRKLKRIILHNEGDTFEISASEMNGAQFATVLATEGMQQPKSKIVFDNGKVTKKIRILADSSAHTLNSEGIANLNTLINFSDHTFGSDTHFEVYNYDTALINQLRGLGKIVDVVNKDDPKFDFS